MTYAVRTGWLLAVVLCLAPAEALAHKVNLFATVEEGKIVGKVYFRGGEPAQNVSVVALAPSGRTLAKSTTDAEGRFQMDANYRCDTKLLTDTGDGHGADFTLKAEDLPEGLPAPDDTAAPPQAVAAPVASGSSEAATEALDASQVKSLHKEIAGLREELDAFKQEIRVRDVLGGIGYILGLSGVAFYVLAIRGRQ